MGRLGKQRDYPSDLTDAQWALVEGLIPPQPPGPGRPRVVDLRQIVNGVLYVTRTGCGWEYVPTSFGAWQTVRYYFDQWTADGTFVRINDRLRDSARARIGREASPSAGVLDSKSVKTTEAGGERGFDGGKKGARAQVAHAGRHARQPPASGGPTGA